MPLATVLLLAGCASDAPPGLTVLAASSLTEAFTELGADFEASSEAEVTLSFAGSQTLATQVRHGIRADVFASAHEGYIRELAAAGLADDLRPLARNTLVLAVPQDREPLQLVDLPSVEHLVVGGEEVPVGRYTEALFDAAEARYGADWRAKVDARVVSREPSVRLVLAKLVLGEADAAVVYRSDLVGVDGVRGVDVPAALGQEARYVQGILASSDHPELAEAWMDFTGSPPARAVLEEHGFEPGE